MPTPLNARQRQAVLHMEGPLLVLAGAGSGKTSVITEKICYLIERCKVAPQHITAVTFTNKAAREMQTRVQRRLQQGTGASVGLSRTKLCTFHRLGLWILSRHLTEAGLRRGFTLYDETDCQRLVEDILKSRNCTDYREQSAALRQQISTWKNAGCSSFRAKQLADNAYAQEQAIVYGEYERLLRACNALDFDDMILRPLQLLQENGRILGRWRQQIRYLLVDEYQDTNASQYQLVSLLTAEHRNLTAVGDDDQAIYAWRGARPENLVSLTRDFPDLKVVKLEQNYRCTGNILHAANTLIARNTHFFEKKLWSEHGPGEAIRVLHCASEEHEAETIVSELVDQKLQRGVRYQDFAILFRSNYQSRLLELKLQTQQVPYQISGGTSLFDRQEIKEVLAYARAIANPRDDAAFLKIINVPRREMGAQSLEKLQQFASAEQVTLQEAAALAGRFLRADKADTLQGLSADLACARERALSHPVMAIRQLLKSLAYEDWLQRQSRNPRQAEKKGLHVDLLLAQLEQLTESADGPQLDLAEALNRLTLRELLSRQEEEALEDRVQLLTLHAAKGLEFPHVIIAGLEEDLLPHRSSVEEGDVQEERRLFYVGMTRARRTLTLTLAQERKQFGERLACRPSRFLEELPEDDQVLLHIGRDKPDAERNRMRGRSTLDALFRQLADDT